MSGVASPYLYIIENGRARTELSGFQAALRTSASAYCTPLTVIPFSPSGSHNLRSSLPPDKPVTSNSEFHLLFPRHAEVVPICKWELTSRHRTSGCATNPTIRGPNQTWYAKSALCECRPPHMKVGNQLINDSPSSRKKCSL